MIKFDVDGKECLIVGSWLKGKGNDIPDDAFNAPKT